MLESLITLAITLGLIALLRPLWMWAFGVNDIVDEIHALRTELQRQNKAPAPPSTYPATRNPSLPTPPAPAPAPWPEEDRDLARRMGWPEDEEPAAARKMR